MKQWTKDIEINAPIDTVWGLLDGSLEDMQKIMPQVETTYEYLFQQISHQRLQTYPGQKWLN